MGRKRLKFTCSLCGTEGLYGGEVNYSLYYEKRVVECLKCVTPKRGVKRDLTKAVKVPKPVYTCEKCGFEDHRKNKFNSSAQIAKRWICHPCTAFEKKAAKLQGRKQLSHKFKPKIHAVIPKTQEHPEAYVWKIEDFREAWKHNKVVY